MYTVIDLNTVDATWNGAPLTLAVNQNANMPQSPNGTVVFAYTNVATMNNMGSISLTSGGGAPTFYQVPALANQPSILVNNWQSNNLSVTNISPNTETPILIQAIGPGIPGTSPLPLDIGTSLDLSFGQTAQGNASPQYMQLVVTCNAATTGILALIGGTPDASGNNGYVIAVNYTIDSGPPTTRTPPPGYYATTTANSYTYQFNWGSSLVFVANLSSVNAAPLTVVMRAL